MPTAFLADLLFMCSPSHLPVYVSGKPLKHWKKELDSLPAQVAKEFVTHVKTVGHQINAFSSSSEKLEENKKCARVRGQDLTYTILLLVYRKPGTELTLGSEIQVKLLKQLKSIGMRA